MEKHCKCAEICFLFCSFPALLCINGLIMHCAAIITHRLDEIRQVLLFFTCALQVNTVFPLSVLQNMFCAQISHLIIQLNTFLSPYREIRIKSVELYSDEFKSEGLFTISATALNHTQFRSLFLDACLSMRTESVSFMEGSR